jgi:predicted AAA+ superfamily ATPase
VEFFRRTYLTESLKGLLAGAVQRLGGTGGLSAGAQAGDPVVQLQTNFGGGKTHSMLALYHLFSGTPAGELLGVDPSHPGQQAQVGSLGKERKSAAQAGRESSQERQAERESQSARREVGQ